jgi:hypothetical protein
LPQQVLTLQIDPPTCLLRKKGLAQESTITLYFLLRNLQRHGGFPSAHQKSGCPASQNAKPRTITAEHFNPSDVAVGVWIELCALRSPPRFQ